jgi:uncharacterized protein YigE (DUF2233 family)
MSVRRQHGTTQLPLDGFEIWYLSLFVRKSVEKIQVSLKSGKNNGNFTWRPINIFIITSHSEYVILRPIAFLLQQRLDERAAML